MNDPNFKANLADINNLDGFHAKIVPQGARRPSKLVEFDQLLDDDKRKIVINNIYGNSGAPGTGEPRPPAPSILTIQSDQTTSQDAYYSHGLFGRGLGVNLATP